MIEPKTDEVKLSEIVFDEIIYPRKHHDPVLVQRYASVLGEIKAKNRFISLTADNKLIDGKHRWLAYRKVYEGNGEDPKIKIFRYDVSTPHEQLKLAVSLNSDHGQQLSEDDKEADAKALFAYGMSYEDIASALSVGKAKISQWLSRTVKENKEKRDRKIFDLWLSCHTQEEIAEAVGLTQRQIDNICIDFRNSVPQNQNSKIASSHGVDFEAPIYNVWKQQEKSSGVSHFGNSEVRWLDNLLYLYTNPFDVVIDPFAGGGSTIDICRKRFRRYYVSDRLPIIERETEIRKHDLVSDGLPKPPQWKDVRLIYLDPPYWIQAQGKYSNDPSDLSNMELETFTAELSKIINGFASKLAASRGDAPKHIALIIQPTQWNAPERQFTDHVGDMLRQVKRPVDMRFSVPYESQQCNAQMVEWAKANKRCLVLTREIIVWRIE